MLWISGPDGLYPFFNREWLAFTGRSLADELGRGWWQGVHHEDRDSLARHSDRAAENREPFTFECRLRRADGQYRWVIGHGSPRLGSTGELIGYVGSCADITDEKGRQREAEEQLRQLRSRPGRARGRARQSRARAARRARSDAHGHQARARADDERAANDRVDRQTVDRIQSLTGLVDIGLSTVKRIATNLRPATLDHSRTGGGHAVGSVGVPCVHRHPLLSAGGASRPA